MPFKAGEKPLVEGKYGPLTDAGVAKVIEHLSEHKGTANCPACYGDEWTIDRHIVFTRIHDSTEGNGYSWVIVRCDGCHNARFFAARALGILPPQ